MAGRCPQYEDYWCPFEDEYIRCPRKDEYCIIAHAAAYSAVSASIQLRKAAPAKAEELLVAALARFTKQKEAPSVEGLMPRLA